MLLIIKVLVARKAPTNIYKYIYKQWCARAALRSPATHHSPQRESRLISHKPCPFLGPLEGLKRPPPPTPAPRASAEECARGLFVDYFRDANSVLPAS
jgi:hypothetical protein